ncbi:hypothetical protein [Mangrovitalea sediminis]|uniref:hypothetical protein n=1 Tax=Mangrovitalea sediminis TaxID=1982043 RepID=UPI0013043E3F|nr:hypothetical protein [Mangrovitalea sediminis]
MMKHRMQVLAYVSWRGLQQRGMAAFPWSGRPPVALPGCDGDDDSAEETIIVD